MIYETVQFMTLKKLFENSFYTLEIEEEFSTMSLEVATDFIYYTLLAIKHLV